LLLTLTLLTRVSASYGDRLPEFRHCVEVVVKTPKCDHLLMT
jgi:hypothetical protein